MLKNFKPIRLPAFVLAFLLLPAVAFAQLPGDLQFGIQLSPTFSSMRSENNLINANGSNLGLKLGLLGEYYFRENYSIHTGIGFHFNTGGTLFYEDRFSRADIWTEPINDFLPTSQQVDSLAGGVSYKYGMQMLEIPLGLTLRTREFGYISYFVRPSLHLGILTGSKGSLSGDQIDFIASDEKINIGSRVNGVNLAWSIGGGIEYSLSQSTALIAGIAYQSGFADLTTDDGNNVRRSDRRNNEGDNRDTVNSIVLMLGIMF